VPGVTSHDLQGLLDDLAERLQSPALLEDVDRRMLAYSAHQGDGGDAVDDIRRRAILSRQSPAEVVAWFERFGIQEAVEPIRTPPNTDLGILGRICAPVRHRGRLLAFLWLIDDPVRCSAEDLALTGTTADIIGALLYRTDLEQRIAGDLLGNLLSPVEEVRALAAEEALERGLLRRGPWTVVTAQPTVTAASDEPDGMSDLELADWLWARGGVTDRRILMRTARAGHVALLVQLASGSSRGAADESPGAAVAGLVQESLRRTWTAARSAGLPAGARVLAAVGSARSNPMELAAAYREARLATRVADALDDLGDVVSWDHLGVFRALAQLPPGEATASAIDQRVLALLTRGDPELVRTVETYLDLAGDAKATAAALCTHRATLYHRLARVEALFGMDMRTGSDRLAVHLGLKVARLAGVHPLPRRP
jgi:hypothetical protein